MSAEDVRLGLAGADEFLVFCRRLRSPLAATDPLEPYPVPPGATEAQYPREGLRQDRLV